MPNKQSLGRVSMVPKGAYNAATVYERLDVVTHNGASYIVLRPVQGVTPVDGEDYMLLVQDGDTPDLSIGTVETLAAGSKATASIGGTPDKPELNLSIPKGDTGAAPVLKMGKVTTLEPDSEATASLSGTAEEPELNLSIPRGASGGVDVANAAVGQTIIVKAVDENGKPTAWEAADMAGGEKEWTNIVTSIATGEVTAVTIDTNNDGEAFSYHELFLIGRNLGHNVDNTLKTLSIYVQCNGKWGKLCTVNVADYSRVYECNLRIFSRGGYYNVEWLNGANNPNPVVTTMSGLGFGATSWGATVPITGVKLVLQNAELLFHTSTTVTLRGR